MVLLPKRPEPPLDLHLSEHHRRMSSMLTRSTTLPVKMAMVPKPQQHQLQLAAVDP